MRTIPMRAWHKVGPMTYEHISGDCVVFRFRIRDWRYKSRTSAHTDGPYPDKRSAMVHATSDLNLMAGPPG